MIFAANILPVEEAFRTGALEMSTKIEEGILQASVNSPAEVITSVVIAFTGLIFLFNLGSFVRLLPKISGALVNKNIGYGIEHNERSSASRNLFALLISVPLCFVFDTLDLLRNSFLEGMDHHWRSMILIAVLVVYYLLRLLLSKYPRPRRCSLDAWSSVNKGWLNGYILAALAGLTLTLLFHIIGIPIAGMRVIFIVIFSIFIALGLFKDYQIMREYCSVLGSILYLCGLEILPTAALVAYGLI